MRTPAARWWAPAVTPAAIGLIALGSTSVALAGIDLTTSLRDAEPAAAPIETELTPVTPADDGADTPAPVDDAAPTEEVVDDDAVDVATPTPSITVPDVDTGEVADAATDVVEDVAETVTDVTDAVDLPGVGLGGARSSNNAGGAQRADVDGGNGNGNGNAGGNDNGNGGGKPDEPPGQVGRDEPVAPPAEQPDAGDDQHPSGRDRSVEPGGSGAQGGAQSDPDDDGRGPDRSNGGVDQAGGAGGVDRGDQDGNNGCGNDDDFEDDNEGWCGRRPRPQEPAPSAAPAPAAGASQPERADSSGEETTSPSARSDGRPAAEERSSSTGRSRNARRASGDSTGATPAAASVDSAPSADAPVTPSDAADADDEELVALSFGDADETPARSTRQPVSTQGREERRVSARSGAGARITQLLEGNPAGRVVLSTASTVSGAALAFTGLDAIVLVLIGAGAVGGGIALLRLSRRDLSRSRT